MKSILLVSVLALFMNKSTSSTATCVGQWTTTDDDTGKKKSIVELFKVDGKLYGKIIKLYPKEGREDDPKCVKCSGEQKNKKIVGMQIVNNLKWNGEEWAGGTILDPANGKVYTSKMWLEPTNDKILNVRGYIGPFFRTQAWKRVEN